MTGSIIIRALGVVLQYGVLLFLFLFVAGTSKKLFTDMKREKKSLAASETGIGEAVLEVVKGDDELLGRRFAFTDEISIGRGTENDIVISDNFVSHHHAVIFRTGGQFVIEDLGSVNPTLVNGQTVHGRRMLKLGDMIQVGMAVLKFAR